MSEIDGKAVLTTGEVARICHVAPRTVSKWFDAGELRGYRIPGSRDRRIPADQLQVFMQAHGIPLDAFSGGTCRILIVTDETQQANSITIALNGSDRYDVRTTTNGFEAGVLAQQFRPHAIVLDIDRDLDGAMEICHKIKATPLLQSTKVIAATEPLTDSQRDELINYGFDECLTKPYSAGQLLQAAENVTNFIT